MRWTLSWVLLLQVLTENLGQVQVLNAGDFGTLVFSAGPSQKRPDKRSYWREVFMGYGIQNPPDSEDFCTNINVLRKFWKSLFKWSYIKCLSALPSTKPESHKAYIVLDRQHFQLENIDEQCSAALAYEMTTVLNPSSAFKIIVFEVLTQFSAKDLGISKSIKPSAGMNFNETTIPIITRVCSKAQFKEMKVLRLGLVLTDEQYQKVEEPLFAARGVTRFGLSTFNDVPMELSSFSDYDTFRLRYFNFFDDSPTLSISHFLNALKSITNYIQRRYELYYLHTSYTTTFRRCSRTDQEFPELIVYIKGAVVIKDLKHRLASLLDETSEVYKETLESVYKSLSDTIRAWELDDCVSSLIVDPFMRESEAQLTAVGHIGFDFIYLMKKIPHLFNGNDLELFVRTYSEKPTVGIYEFRMKAPVLRMSQIFCNQLLASEVRKTKPPKIVLDIGVEEYLCINSQEEPPTSFPSDLSDENSYCLRIPTDEFPIDNERLE
ncbi:hypothetical protein CRM22_009716 [Opisthorchis felineus]|uniref:SEA domain-containing protein n=1 Tax=Opisthorchis felineus TaxID=147828 RepID=A0A4S2LCH2_OPIFE|nr:hypothetical protein CRM22_009716 [Opisthorchis felineus]